VIDEVALKRKLGRFASIRNVYWIGYFLGRNPALANTRRECVGSPDLHAVVLDLSALSPTHLSRPLRRRPGALT
jgi:hypothetical protein